ncbi:B3 domain-containing protein LOC_Os12g40080-like isoform X1 [Lycium ferocissimum]|uniref:B3 domain-containing protein LOC_Os12g40080-like isoform X1 n=1 Tax=Lycium ferocissimum TaxID=112874 RepID=UPI002815DF4A|nr:B3 domain-containing protein LOC_Os12g40080-like isoform X1 [Lycium ferocissimum]
MPNKGSSNFSSTNILQPKFYKIIFSPQCCLRIPEDFASRYCKNLQNLAYLEVPTGKVWEVEVVHSEGQIWLAKGWRDFSDYYSIDCGHFLMFGYNGLSHFNVTIFDLSATEIEYPTTEIDSDDSIEILEVDPESHKGKTNVPDVVEHSVENIGHCSLGQTSKRKTQDGDEEDDVSVDIQTNVIKEEVSQGEHKQQSQIVPSKNEADGHEDLAVSYQRAKILEVDPESHRGIAKVPDVVEHSAENIGHCSFGQASKRKTQDGDEKDDVLVDIQTNVIEEGESHKKQAEIVPHKNEAEGREEIAVNYQRAKILEVYPERHWGKEKVPDVVERSVENMGQCSLGQTSKRKRQDGVEEDDVSVDTQTNIIEEEDSQGKHKQQFEIVPSTNEAEEHEKLSVNNQRAKILEVDPESHRGKAKVLDVVEHSVENIGHCSLGQASKRKRQDGVEEDDVSVDTQTNVIEEEGSPKQQSEIVPIKSEVEGGEEIAVNYQRAKAFKSNNPFIISFMRSLYVSHSFSLSIPKKFAKRHFLNRRNLVLSVTGKGSWSVKCTLGAKNAKISWKAFVLDNKLKTGDACVFEVIEPFSMNVTIFPAVSLHEIAGEATEVSDQCSQYISAAYQRAKAFTSEHPFFIRVMQPSYVSGKSLTIPRVIGWEFFSTKRSDLVLQVPSKRSKRAVRFPSKRSWALKCFRAKEYAKLSSGWKEFVLDNNIKAGDVCVFEQINRSNLLFNVHIFPADEDV